MANYRDRLSQLEPGPELTVGGLEMYFIFNAGLDLPQFHVRQIAAARSPLLHATPIPQTADARPL
jgi:hypothetical protein